MKLAKQGALAPKNVMNKNGRCLRPWNLASAVSTFIDDNLRSIPLSQRQVGVLAGLGPNRSNRVGEQRKIGKGSRPTALKVISVIVAQEILIMAGVGGVDVLCTYGGHTKEEVEAEGSIEETGKKTHSLPHPVKSCPEWKQACSSTLAAVISVGGVCSNGAMILDNVIKVFWTLLSASAARSKSSEGVFSKGLEALKTDSKLVSVVDNWLNQSKSQASLIKKTFGLKSHGKRQAADGDVSTSSETSEKKAREGAGVPVPAAEAPGNQPALG
jgi:hypothetical protein